ncbi:MAG: type III polyketide synthase [Bacteroidia bacterium]|nr:type III polyketide synthase [Bacteroidia bacterium]
MSYILNISTAVPEFRIEKEDLARFYSEAFAGGETSRFIEKLNFLSKRTKIETRYSCIPDYKGNEHELFTEGNYKQPIEKRMDLYRKKIMPLTSAAIDKLFAESSVKPNEITHLITVSCTGLMTPGLEFLIAEKYGLQYTEKSAVNFLGCYAAMKALKQAHYIAQSDPTACILIVSAELCSLHFYPSDKDEDVVANLLFADGAAAAIVCGDKNKLAENKVVLQIDKVGTSFIPDTADLMTWEIGSSAFRMHLSAKVVTAIKENILAVVSDFSSNTKTETDYWAIHPGGAKIVEAVQESLNLTKENVSESMEVLRNYGNMSSPTILFVLKNIFSKIKEAGHTDSKKIFSCAFGPGLNIEMISLSSIDTTVSAKFNHFSETYAVQS